MRARKEDRETPRVGGISFLASVLQTGSHSDEADEEIELAQREATD
jgi:hypothetical protein